VYINEPESSIPYAKGVEKGFSWTGTYLEERRIAADKDECSLVSSGKSRFNFKFRQDVRKRIADENEHKQ
jgi:hypothetical protein